MKKIICIVLAAIMVAALAIVAGANCMFPAGDGWNPDDICRVKKADSAKVVKDGVISQGEYERFVVDVGEDTSHLSLPYITGENFEQALAMMATIEFYFSWDEVHGINIAVRNKPEVIQQLLDVKTGDKPEDDFLHNTAYVVNGESDGSNYFYFALGKRTDDGRYLEGHYQQFGALGSYDPTPGTDYVISYGSDGYATIEWSIPLKAFLTAGGGAGSRIQFTITAMGGTTTEPEDYSDFYGVGLGDFCYAMNQKTAKNHVTYLLTDDVIDPGDPTQPVDPGDPTQPVDPGDPTQPVDPGDPTQPVDPGDPTQPVDPGDPTQPVDPGNPDQPDNPGQPDNPDQPDNPGQPDNPTQPPASGDPMIVIAAVSALSAAGAFVIRRRRH